MTEDILHAQSDNPSKLTLCGIPFTREYASTTKTVVLRSNVTCTVCISIMPSLTSLEDKPIHFKHPDSGNLGCTADPNEAYCSTEPSRVTCTSCMTYFTTLPTIDLTKIPHMSRSTGGHDAVEHPEHYTSHPSGVEHIQISSAFNFCKGNVIKYVWRAGLKSDNELEDLRKARWYLNYEIERLENDQQGRV